MTLFIVNCEFVRAILPTFLPYVWEPGGNRIELRIPGIWLCSPGWQPAASLRKVINAGRT